MSPEDQTKFKAQTRLDVCWVRMRKKTHITANMKSTSGTLVLLQLHFRNVFGKQFAQINNSAHSNMIYVINSLVEGICTLLQKKWSIFKRKIKSIFSRRLKISVVLANFFNL